jgi:hypothetical protein
MIWNEYATSSVAYCWFDVFACFFWALSPVGRRSYTKRWRFEPIELLNSFEPAKWPNMPHLIHVDPFS